MYPPFPIYSPPRTPRPAFIPGRGLAIMSFILGICAIVLGCCISYYAAPLGVTGLVLGIIGCRQAKTVGVTSGLGVTGIVLSSVALALIVLWSILLLLPDVLFASGGSGFGGDEYF
jgi:hypothetical protein